MAMSEKKKSSKGRFGCLSGVWLIILTVMVSAVALFMICLPYGMLISNKKTAAEAQIKGITEIRTTITEKEEYESTDLDGYSTTDYYIRFPEGTINNSTWYKRVNVGDTVTVYTVDGKQFAFTKDGLFHTKGDIGFTFAISNALLSVFLGLLLYSLYNRKYEKDSEKDYKSGKVPQGYPRENIHSVPETDYDAVNRFFLAHISRKEKMQLTRTDFILGLLIVINFIVYVVQRYSILLFVLFGLGIWLIFHIRNKKKKQPQRSDFLKAVSRGDYYTITLRVIGKDKEVISDGEYDSTIKHTIFENEQNITDSEIYDSTETGSLVHFFVISDNECSQVQIIEKTPGRSEEYKYCEQQIAVKV